MDDIVEFSGAYRFLSNFWPAVVYLDDEEYRSTEYAFHAGKTFDPAMRRMIREAVTPGQAKRLGRHVPLRPDWEEVKVPFMLDLNRQKFAHPELREALLATGTRRLVEGNTWRDTFWGVDLRTGKGQNKLGLILMLVRQEIREGRS